MRANAEPAAGAGGHVADPGRVEVGALAAGAAADLRARRALPRDPQLHPARGAPPGRRGVRRDLRRLPHRGHRGARGAGGHGGAASRLAPGADGRRDRAARPDRGGGDAGRRHGPGGDRHRPELVAPRRAPRRSARSAHRSAPPSRPEAWRRRSSAGRAPGWSARWRTRATSPASATDIAGRPLRSAAIRFMQARSQAELTRAAARGHRRDPGRRRARMGQLRRHRQPGAQRHARRRHRADGRVRVLRAGPVRQLSLARPDAGGDLLPARHPPSRARDRDRARRRLRGVGRARRRPAAHSLSAAGPASSTATRPPAKCRPR